MIATDTDARRARGVRRRARTEWVISSAERVRSWARPGEPGPLQGSRSFPRSLCEPGQLDQDQGTPCRHHRRAAKNGLNATKRAGIVGLASRVGLFPARRPVSLPLRISCSAGAILRKRPVTHRQRHANSRQRWSKDGRPAASAVTAARPAPAAEPQARTPGVSEPDGSVPGREPATGRCSHRAHRS